MRFASLALTDVIGPLAPVPGGPLVAVTLDGISLDGEQVVSLTGGVPADADLEGGAKGYQK